MRVRRLSALLGLTLLFAAGGFAKSPAKTKPKKKAAATNSAIVRPDKRVPALTAAGRFVPGAEASGSEGQPAGRGRGRGNSSYPLSPPPAAHWACSRSRPATCCRKAVVVFRLRATSLGVCRAV